MTHKSSRAHAPVWCPLVVWGALLACGAGADPSGGGGTGAGAGAQGGAGGTPPTSGGSGGQGGAGAGAVGGAGGSGAGFGGFGGSGGTGGFLECATFSAEAQQAPAAILFVLDKSASMTTQQKWSTAQLAVVSAIDADAFDSLSLGLVTFPSSFTATPQCLCDACCGGDVGLCNLFIPQVSCGVSGLPQVAITPAGTLKSNQGGVRQDIYNYLASNSPLTNSDDGSPIYDALVSGYNALQAIPIEQRILVLVTDGGFSCTSVSSPQRPGYSDGACLDWEYPDSVNALIANKYADPSDPVFTFVLGLPGSNSNGEMQGSFATAPYSMRRALSSYAHSGAPLSVDPGCDVPDAVFDTNGTDPIVPCHIDLSVGAFNASSFADAITAIRGEALGCIYELPEPPLGETIDPAKVNVTLTLEGTPTDLPKRADPSNECLVNPCWDYNADGQVELIGKACSDLILAADATVEIVVGCDTVVR